MAKIPKLPDTGINVGIVTTSDSRPELWSPQPGPQTMVMLSDEFEIFFGGAKGGGKLGTLESMICTPKGFVRMGDIKVGDVISDPTTGGTCVVIAVHPQGVKKIWKLTFDDDASTEVGAEHLWAYRVTGRRKPKSKPSSQRDYSAEVLRSQPLANRWDYFRVGKTSELVEELNAGRGVRIPLTSPIVFTANWRPRTNLPTYLLGLYLGDGHLDTATITNIDAEIHKYLLDLGTYRVSNEKTIVAEGHHRKQVRHFFYMNGLLKCRAWEKFIPEPIKFSGIEDRVGLLQGLLDSDGTVDERGRAYFCSTSRRLAEDVAWVVRSLGGKARIRTRHTQYSYKGEKLEGRESYNVRIWHPTLPALFRLTRKGERCRLDWNGGTGELTRQLIKAEYVGEREAQCITVSNPYGLYLTDDFIVTHNSYCIIGWLLKGNPSVPLDKATPLDLSYINCPDYRALVVRKNLEDLNSWISEAYSIYSKLGANYTQKPNEFTFPSGAKIIMGHLDDDRAAEKYFGNVVHRAAVDELTFIDNLDNYTKLYSCVRSNVTGIEAQMLLTGNPGGPGTSWVMSRFVEPIDDNGDIIPPLTTMYERKWNPFTHRVEAMTRIFIPASLKDNPKLIEKDPLYYNRLAGLPETQRKAYLEGDWHAMGGTFYPEFRSKHREGEPPEALHVIPSGSRPLMPWLPRFAACDWGFSHHAVVYGAVKDLNGQTIIHKELVVSEIGSVELGYEIGRLLLPDLEGLYKSGASPLITLWLSVDAFDKRDTVKTQAEGIAEGIARVIGPGSVHLPDFFVPHPHMVESDLFSQVRFQGKSGIAIAPAQTARIAGAAYVREMLRWLPIVQADQEKFDYEIYYNLIHTSMEKAQVYFESFQRRKAEVLPKLLIEDHCKHLIGSIPALVCDKKHMDDVLKTDALCDDVYDALRYLLFSEDVAGNKEPRDSYVAKQLRKVREQEPNIDYNSLVWAARKAEEDYASQNRMGAFSVPNESSRSAKSKRTQ